MVNELEILRQSSEKYKKYKQKYLAIKEKYKALKNLKSYSQADEPYQYKENKTASLKVRIDFTEGSQNPVTIIGKQERNDFD